MISAFTRVIKSKLKGPNAQVTHNSGLAQWRRFFPGDVGVGPIYDIPKLAPPSKSSATELADGPFDQQGSA